MATLRVCPSFAASRLFPGADVEIKTIGFDRFGTLIFELSGEAVPEGAAEIEALIHTEMAPDETPLRERIEFRART